MINVGLYYSFPVMSSRNDPSPESSEIERARDQMERDWKLRQENVLPLPAAWNEGRFYGLVMLGKQALTIVQRIGILLVALPLAGFGLMLVLTFLPEWIVGSHLKGFGEVFPPTPSTIFGISFALIVGFRFSWVAFKPNRE
jgi:hypothetical protein